ncbi:MAG: glycosyltransferase family 2 protein [Deltaproteobacteria bacterium]|nr:glycosyltransferase family 2 protein [Deltaproteobacteria bacterium]
MAEVQPDLTICVAACGVLESTRRFLRAVYATAGHAGLEVFVLGLGRQAEAAALAAEFPAIAMLGGHPGENMTKTINRAVHESGGRYVSVWDAGSVVTSGCLTSLVEFLDEAPEAGIAGPKIRNESGEIQQVARTSPSIFSLLLPSGMAPGRPAAGWNEYGGGETDWFAGPGLTVSRHLLDDIGGFHPGLTLYWPVEFCLRARRAGWHVHYLHEAQAAGSLGAWRQALSAGQESFLRRLWEACLLKVTWRFRSGV